MWGKRPDRRPGRPCPAQDQGPGPGHIPEQGELCGGRGRDSRWPRPRPASAPGVPCSLDRWQSYEWTQCGCSGPSLTCQEADFQMTCCGHPPGCTARNRSLRPPPSHPCPGLDGGRCLSGPSAGPGCRGEQRREADQRARSLRRPPVRRPLAHQPSVDERTPRATFYGVSYSPLRLYRGHAPCLLTEHPIQDVQVLSFPQKRNQIYTGRSGGDGAKLPDEGAAQTRVQAGAWEGAARARASAPGLPCCGSVALGRGAPGEVTP